MGISLSGAWGPKSAMPYDRNPYRSRTRAPSRSIVSVRRLDLPSMRLRNNHRIGLQISLSDLSIFSFNRLRAIYLAGCPLAAQSRPAFDAPERRTFVRTGFALIKRARSDGFDFRFPLRRDQAASGSWFRNHFRRKTYIGDSARSKARSNSVGDMPYDCRKDRLNTETLAKPLRAAIAPMR
jgi:hypothetical protein